MELKELLKEARKQTGMTQKQFAEYFRIPYRTLEDWERGDSAGGCSMLSRL